MEEGRLRRIEILGGSFGIERPAAECDDPALRILDREHDPIAKSVVRAWDVVAADQHATLDHRLDRKAEAGEMLPQRRPVARRIAHAKMRDCLPLEAASIEISSRVLPLGGPQLLLEESGRGFDQLVEIGALGALSLGLPGRFRRASFGHRQHHAGLARQSFHRFRKCQTFGFHDEAEDVAMRTRGEAVIEAFLIVHEERRRLLDLERR